MTAMYDVAIVRRSQRHGCLGSPWLRWSLCNGVNNFEYRGLSDLRYAVKCRIPPAPMFNRCPDVSSAFLPQKVIEHAFSLYYFEGKAEPFG